MIGVKASSYSPRINATYEAKGERQAILRNKVIKCLSEVKHSGGARPYKTLLKLMHDEEFTDSEMNWIREFGNFDMIYKPTKKFYENWRTS